MAGDSMDVKVEITNLGNKNDGLDEQRDETDHRWLPAT